jgi:hypothetical protein
MPVDSRQSVTVQWTVPTDASPFAPEEWRLPGLLRYIESDVRDTVRQYQAIAYGYGPVAQALGRLRLGFSLGLIGAVLWPGLVVQWALRTLAREKAIREMTRQAGREP